MVVAVAISESQPGLVGKFEGLIVESEKTTSIRAVRTWPKDVQRSSAPLIKEFGSEAVSLCSFDGAWTQAQPRRRCHVAAVADSMTVKSVRAISLSRWSYLH